MPQQPPSQTHYWSQQQNQRQPRHQQLIARADRQQQGCGKSEEEG